MSGATIPQPRGENGQYISIEKYIHSLFAGLREEIALRQKALELQAKEYARRLEDLNHAHARAEAAKHTFVSTEKYESQMASEKEAREIALLRLNEMIDSVDDAFNKRLTEYITKADQREAEREQEAAMQEGAALEAASAAEKMGREAKEQAAKLAREQTAESEARYRKTNRNTAWIGLALGVVYFVMNYLLG